MKLANLLSSALVVTASVALTSGIASAQTTTSATSNGQLNIAINSNTLDSNSTNISYLQPFNLVSLAYQGGLKQQGIPSGGSLVFEHQNRQLTSEDLVKAAVNANKLPAQILNDQNYLNAVRLQLSSLSRNFVL